MNLIKKTPLAAKGRKLNAATTEIGQWQVINNFDKKEVELHHLNEHAVIADWSHIGKIDIHGLNLEKELQNIFSVPEDLAVGQVFVKEDIAVMRLLKNRYLVLTKAETESGYIEQLQKKNIEHINVTGAKSCLALAGPKKQNLIERASTINLNKEAFQPHSVVQTTVHTILCTIVRLADVDLFLTDQTYAESLFDAFIDFSQSANLIPAGIETLPISFQRS